MTPESDAASDLKRRQPIRLKRGQVVEVDAGRGARILITKYRSGAVEVTNALTGASLRSFSPKEARDP